MTNPPTSMRRLSPEMRAAIRASTDSVRGLGSRLGVNPKTIQRWRHRATTADQPFLRRAPATALSSEEVETIISFRQSTRLALDDCLHALQPLIPDLRRATLHRCLQRHAVSRLGISPRPGRAGDGTAGLGTFRILMSPAPTRNGQAYLFVATNQRTHFAFATVHASAAACDAAGFLLTLTDAMPFTIDTVLTDGSHCFTGTPDSFRRMCHDRAIRHIVTTTASAGKPDAGSRYFQYSTPAELDEKLAHFLSVMNFSQRLKTLGGITPHEALCALWRVAPGRFARDPTGMRQKANIAPCRVNTFSD